MKRQLMALNLLLLALLCGAGYRFFAMRTGFREREERVLGKRVAAKSYPPLPAIPAVVPMTGANYVDVAQKMLLSKDRNPTVIIDPDPPPAKKPMPPLPVVQGLMNLGSPSIIMSERPGAGQKTYHAGDKVGAFTLVAFDSEKVVLDWEGERLERTLDELIEKVPPPNAAAQASPLAGVPAQAPAPAQAEAKGPGGDIGGGYRGCIPNDSTPSGTVRDGVRKVEIVTPFGKSCRWEPVR